MDKTLEFVILAFCTVAIIAAGCEMFKTTTWREKFKQLLLLFTVLSLAISAIFFFYESRMVQTGPIVPVGSKTMPVMNHGTNYYVDPNVYMITQVGYFVATALFVLSGAAYKIIFDKKRSDQ